MLKTLKNLFLQNQENETESWYIALGTQVMIFGWPSTFYVKDKFASIYKYVEKSFSKNALKTNVWNL